MIPIKEPLVSDIWAYLQVRLPLTNNATFISETGNRLSPTSVQLMFTKYIKKAGLDGKGYTIHKLRHSFATHMIQNGADLITVQNILGHSDLNNTKIYTHTDTNHLREQLDKLPF
jgi:integrase/recombinase XerD